jgi:hypothetical protein
MARVVVAGLSYHVTQCGNGREPIFCDDGDQDIYCDLLVSTRAQVRRRGLGLLFDAQSCPSLVVPHDETGLARAVRAAHRRL